MTLSAPSPSSIGAALAVTWTLSFVPAASSGEPLQALVFSGTAGYRHESIPDAVRAVRKLAAERDWSVEATEASSSFTDDELARFDVVVFLMTTGDVLDRAQEAAFERYVRSGGGYVGVHSAADTEYDWPFYGRLVGAYFRSHPEIQEATYVVEDPAHPATTGLPRRWRRVDEHYAFRSNPRASVDVLISLDETSYRPRDGGMGDHPVAWCHELEGGRSFYTALGHTSESYEDVRFLRHLAGAMLWAAGR